MDDMTMRPNAKTGSKGKTYRFYTGRVVWFVLFCSLVVVSGVVVVVVVVVVDDDDDDDDADEVDDDDYYYYDY